MEKERPLLTIRPHFDQGLVTMQAILFTAASFLPVTVIGGTIFYVLLHLIGIGRFIGAGYIYGLFLVGSLVVLPPLFFELKRKAYSRTFFRFYQDFVDCQYFRLLVRPQRLRLRYRGISDVVQTGGALQSQRGLTSILLFVPNMKTHPRVFGGVKIVDVPSRLDLMPKVLDIVEQSEYRDMAQYAAAQGAAVAEVQAPPQEAASAQTQPPQEQPPAAAQTAPPSAEQP